MTVRHAPLLDQALEEAGIDRGRVYVTNTVKHFKWVGRGKRRIHKTPLQRHMAKEEMIALGWMDAAGVVTDGLESLLPRTPIPEKQARSRRPALAATGTT